MTVFIEYVLIDNFVIDYMLLKLAFFTCGVSVKKIRLIISAIIGSVIALALPLVSHVNILTILIKLFTGVLMVAVCASKEQIKKYIAVALVFFVYTFCLGGALYAIFGAFNIPYTQEITIALIFAPAYIVLKSLGSVLKFIYRRKNLAPYIYTVNLILGETKITTSGFLDTGNGLYEKGIPVIICLPEIANKFLAVNMPKITRVKVGTVNGVSDMPAITLDRVETFGGGKCYNYSKVVMGVSKTGFECGYQVILHPQLFGGENQIKKPENLDIKGRAAE